MLYESLLNKYISEIITKLDVAINYYDVLK